MTNEQFIPEDLRQEVRGYFQVFREYLENKDYFSMIKLLREKGRTLQKKLGELNLNFADFDIGN
mgnify:CR=1 FL=1